MQLVLLEKTHPLLSRIHPSSACGCSSSFHFTHADSELVLLMFYCVTIYIDIKLTCNDDVTIFNAINVIANEIKDEYNTKKIVFDLSLKDIIIFKDKYRY